MRDTGLTPSRQDGDVVLGDDWVAPDQTVAAEMQVKRARRGFFSLKGSPLTRKIITFNLIALIILVAGILYLNSSRQSLVKQRAGALVAEVSLIADVFEAVLPSSGAVSLTTGDGIDPLDVLEGVTLRGGVEAFVFDTSGVLVAQVTGVNRPDALNALNEGSKNRTLISDGLSRLWTTLGGAFQSEPVEGGPIKPLRDQLQSLVRQSLTEGAKIEVVGETSGGTVLSAVAPILSNGTAIGVVALASPSGEIDALVRGERERVLQIFIIALLVSVGLSLVLASTIANPLADLAEAAELGRERNSRKAHAGRIRIPDLSARPDEIGRLSRALRGMVKALYSRIDSNEQFASSPWIITGRCGRSVI